MTFLSPTTRLALRQILPFPIIWILFSVVFLVSDWAAYVDGASIPAGAIRLTPAITLFALAAIGVVGSLVGVIEHFYLKRRFTQGSLVRKLFTKTAFYVVFLSSVILITFPIAASMELDTTWSDPRVWDRFQLFVFSKTSVATAVQLTTSLMVSLFYSEIGRHMGPGVLPNFLLGRYHTPKAEERVFLFSDMKSSTAIAERLGSVEYFAFLQAYYDAFANAVVRFGGEVYQYVGDEIIVSWPASAGVWKGQAVRCALAMSESLKDKAPWFQERFGVAPSFKAALQVGPVTTGEIGALKKEIVFTGDVLNQAARIQALCGEYGEDLLLGGDLVRRLPSATDLSYASLGVRQLRGKEKGTELFRVAHREG